MCTGAMAKRSCERAGEKTAGAGSRVCAEQKQGTRSEFKPLLQQPGKAGQAKKILLDNAQLPLLSSENPQSAPCSSSHSPAPSSCGICLEGSRSRTTLTNSDVRLTLLLMGTVLTVLFMGSTAHAAWLHKMRGRREDQTELSFRTPTPCVFPGATSGSRVFFIVM